MKTIAAFCLLGFLCFNAPDLFAQGGTIDFHNTVTTRVQYTLDGQNTYFFPQGNQATLPGYGEITIALMAAPDGTPLTTLPNGQPNFTSPWTEAVELNNVGPLAGLFSPGVAITLPASAGVPGALDEVSVVAWTGPATSWQQAISGNATMLGWAGSTLSGGALEWEQPTGVDPSSAVELVTGNDAFNGVVLTPTPEPSPALLLGSFALGGWVLFHRLRKRDSLL